VKASQTSDPAYGAGDLAPGQPDGTTNIAQRDRVLAPTQLAILGAETWSPDQNAFTVVSAVRVAGVPDWRALVDAVYVTLGRHDVFTWRLDLDASYQVVAVGGPSDDGIAYAVEQVDLTRADPIEAEVAIQERLCQERQRVIRLFDAASRPYTRAILFHLSRDTPTGGSEGVCALVTHHFFVDEYSTELIWNEIFRRSAGRVFTGGYDRRYADWARDSVCDAARAEATLAAQDIVELLAAHPLGSVIEQVPAHPADVAASPLRFSIPAGLNAAAAARARDLAVPVSAVYATALVNVLCAHASGRSLAVSMPMTRRRGAADMDIVGCYVSAVPVLAEHVSDNVGPEAAIQRWHRSLTYSSARAHADVETIRAGVGRQEVWLAFEARGGRRTANPIRWATLPPPDSPAKSALAIYLSPGSRHENGDGRVLWRAGILSEQSARTLVAEFLTALAVYARDEGKDSEVGAA
jgi:hypothetical protein